MASRSSASLRNRNTSSSGNTSGLNISRAQEKEQLETLNDRLAVYIDTVRRLEHDNRELKVNSIRFHLEIINNNLYFIRMLLHHIAIHMKLKHQRLNNCMNVNLKMQKN
jgi:hypothetical protein